jgi:hypothetical protein
MQRIPSADTFTQQLVFRKQHHRNGRFSSTGAAGRASCWLWRDHLG